MGSPESPILHLSALEAAGAAIDESGLYDRRFLFARPLIQALETSPCELLADELDPADDEFEAFLQVISHA